MEQRSSSKLAGCGNFPDSIFSEICVSQLASKLRLGDLASVSVVDGIICASFSYAVRGPAHLLQRLQKQTDMPGKLSLHEEHMHGIEVVCERWHFAANSIVREQTSFHSIPAKVCDKFLGFVFPDGDRGQTHVAKKRVPCTPSL